MARKGQFKKGGGRVGDPPRSTALVVVSKPVRRRAPSGAAKRHHRPHPMMTREAIESIHPSAIGPDGRIRRRRRSRKEHPVTLVKLGVATAVLQSVAESGTGPAGASVFNLVQKLPGTKTLGGAATAGLYLGALGKFTSLGNRPTIGPWLKAAGAVGVVLGIAKAVTQGKDFKWLGDVGHHNASEHMGDIGDGFDSEG